MYKIYQTKRGQRKLIDITDSYRLAEMYIETVKHCTIEDTANEIDQASDKELSELYGVSTRREMEAAFNVCFCGAMGLLLLIAAFFTQL